MQENTFTKLCAILIEKIDNLEFVVKFKERQNEELSAENTKLKAENEKLKAQKQAVTEFVDRTRVETRG